MLQKCGLRYPCYVVEGGLRDLAGASEPEIQSIRTATAGMLIDGLTVWRACLPALRS